MRTKPTTGRANPLLAVLSQVPDVLAPIIAVLVTAVLVLERTPRREPFLYAILIGALVVLTGASARSRGAYGLWALYIGGFALFSLIRSFADDTGLPTHVGGLVTVEKSLAFGIVPTVWLQERLFDPAQIGWLDRAATYVHWSYFVLPHLFAAHLYFGYRHLFERYVQLFVGVLAVGLLIYFAFPAAPPWVASLRGDLDPTYKVVTEVGSELHVNIYRYFENQIRASNPVAAIPSIHMAISFAVLLMSFRVSRALGLLALAYNAAMAVSLVYLGEHYVVDIAAGIVVTVAVYAGLEAWSRLRGSEPEPEPEPEPPLELAPGRGVLSRRAGEPDQA